MQQPSKQKKQLKPYRDWLNTVTPNWTWDWRYQQYIESVLAKVTAGELKRVMLFVPPRHGKSEMVTVRYPVYRLEHNKEFRTIVGAYNQTLADKFSRKSRKIARERVELSTERTAASDWETPQGGGVRAVGVGGGVTGQGADLIIIDDPVKSREEAESLAYRERCWSWYTDDIYTRLEPGGAVILIMTRWHEDDLAGRILASEDASNWTVIKFPALAEEADALGREPGQALCPERFNEQALEDIRRVVGSYAFAALYQQRPAPAEGGIIKRDWIRYWDKLPERFERIIQSWDMAFKDGAKNDFVVGQVWGRLGADFYLIEQVRDRWDFPATQEQVKKLTGRYPQATAKYIEDAANGPAIIASLRREVSGMIPVPAKGSKEARLHAAAPLFEAGNVLLPRTHWIDEYVNELCTFNNGTHDDQVDATSQAIEKLQGKTLFIPQSGTAQR